jgi:L-ascorbate metabolism protein UlaG (beta-lactamase superfamily)
MSAIHLHASSGLEVNALIYALAVTNDHRLAVSWLGHATVVIDIAGVRFVTDPALTPRLAHLRRHHVVDLDAVAGADVVLISHVHLDHLHLPSLRLLDAPNVVVPVGAGGLLRRQRFTNVVETRVGDVATFGAVTVQTVPAVHAPDRGPHSRVRAPAVGYVLNSGRESVYFAGDTDLFDAMTEFAAVDVALLPIGGWGRSLGPGHLDPQRAAQATDLIVPRLVVPIHWGTYSPIGVRGRRPAWLHRPAEQFAVAMDEAGHGSRLRLLEPGERVVSTSASRLHGPSA